ncbi:hypothetical protein CRG98_008980 [Punica granatum]|uniref:Reverse transcriptase Ty1/copia-type domain-containing protein n=1 Tax=Punica granatum TaxID=22663 RepID=A0A2I0KQJ7_PUNGR|nr:hypothetical protein CRG98_008980 [Punica granatum]
MGRQIVLDEESSVPQTDHATISMDTDKPVETPTQIENVTEPRRSSRVTRTPARYLNLHENVETYKARLVAKGYRKRHGVDYEETFSLVAMLKSTKIMLAIAAHYDYKVSRMDVMTAFLNGYIEEGIFID